MTKVSVRPLEGITLWLLSQGLHRDESFVRMSPAAVLTRTPLFFWGESLLGFGTCGSSRGLRFLTVWRHRDVGISAGRGVHEVGSDAFRA